MSVFALNPLALSKLKDLACWLKETAKMQEESLTPLRCVDKDRYNKAYPLLDSLGCCQINGYGYVIFRIAGKASIKPTPNFQSFFFPLTIYWEPEEMRVEDKVLIPGNYIILTCTLILDAVLDCLIILLPGTGER